MHKTLLGAFALLLSVMLVCISACSHRAKDADSPDVTSSDLMGETDSAEVVVEDSADDTVEFRELTVSPTEENARPISRTCTIDGVTWLPQSGSALEFVATGTHLSLEMVGDDAVWYEKNFSPRFAVLVDGEVVLDDTMNEPACTIEVFSSESSRSAVVEVMHLSEANEGVVGVRSITIESDAAVPIKPTSPKDLSIEFIGDSITCGYGVEATSVYEPFMTTTQNFMKSYAYLTARALDADYGTACYSGYGIISGWSGDGQRNESMTLPPIYDLVSQEFDQPWDFSTHDYDVVVINLGTNDFSYTWTDESRMQEFAFGYESFLEQVRERNPKSYLICTLGTMGCQELYPYVEQAVASFKEQTGDERVMCYLSDQIDYETDGAGTSGHPNAITQQKSADKLVEVIRDALNL